MASLSETTKDLGDCTVSETKHSFCPSANHIKLFQNAIPSSFPLLSATPRMPLNTAFCNSLNALKCCVEGMEKPLHQMTHPANCSCELFVQNEAVGYLAVWACMDNSLGLYGYKEKQEAE